MDYIHVKSLEKYHPSYKDRKLVWCKTYFTMLNADLDFEMLCEIDKWRFIAFIMLELQNQKPVALNEDYLTRKGFDFKKRSLSLTLQMLHTFTEVMQEPLQKCDVDIEKSRTEKSREEEKKNNIEGRVIIEKTKLENTLDAFIEMRKKIKKPLTDYAIILLHKELNALSKSDESLKIKILEQSITNSWQGIFPLKDNNKYVPQNFSNQKRDQLF